MKKKGALALHTNSTNSRIGQKAADQLPLFHEESPAITSKIDEKLDEIEVRKIEPQIHENESFPKDWKTENLGNIGTWFSGGTPNMSNERYWNGDIPWVSAKDMKVNRIKGSVLYVTSEAIGNGTRIAPKGSVLIVVRGMILAHTFPVALATLPIAFNQDMKALMTRSEINSEFILYWLLSNASKILSITSESTHGTKRIASEDLFALNVGLPTKEEQRAIAEALSDVDALLDSLDRLIAKKRDIKQATMQQLLTGKTRLPGFDGEWQEIKLGELGTWKGGMTPSMQDPTYWQDGTIPWISSGDVKSLHLIETSFSITDAAIGQSKTTLLPANSIVLVTRSGILRKYLPVALALIPMAINQDIKALIPNSNFDSSFLLQSLILRGDQILASCMKAGTTVESVDFRWLKSFPIQVPLLPEQTAIASVLSDLDAEIDALEKRREKTRAIKQGMMQELLTGRTRLV